MDSFHDIYQELQVVAGDKTGYRAPRRVGRSGFSAQRRRGLEGVGSVQVNVYWVLVSHLLLFVHPRVMEHVDKLIERIAEATSKLAPLSQLSAGMPLAPVQPLQSLIQHLQSTNVHDVYFPFVRFAALHAARVATAWAAMTHTRGGNPGVLQDLFGFLTVSCEYKDCLFVGGRG
jgi:hypothetical protein